MSKHVPQFKKDAVKELQQLIESYPIVGVVNVQGLPTPQMQTMRSQLRSTVVLRMTKRRLIKIALEQAAKNKPGVETLISHMKGMPALLLTKENPFKLYKTLQKNKSSAPAKGGQVAPKDIVVKAGPTGFAPGPIIGELGAIGIKSGVDGGKVAIKQDSVVVREGQVIPQATAAILTRLGIQPMEVGLDLLAVYEDKVIYDKSILSVDESQYVSNITQAHQWAFNLGVEAGIYNKDTTTVLLSKAHSQAKAVSLEAAFPTKDTTGDILAKAEAQAVSVQSITQK